VKWWKHSHSYVKALPLDRATRINDVQTVQYFFDTLNKFLDNKAKDMKGKKGCRPDKLLYK
jgi:hypothetical protein